MWTGRKIEGNEKTIFRALNWDTLLWHRSLSLSLPFYSAEICWILADRTVRFPQTDRFCGKSKKKACYEKLCVKLFFTLSYLIFFRKIWIFPKCIIRCGGCCSVLAAATIKHSIFTQLLFGIQREIFITVGCVLFVFCYSFI